MSHGITSTDRAAFSERGAWHGFGTVTDHPMTLDEAYKLALDFEVEESKRLFGAFDSDASADTSTQKYKMLRRSDNHEILGVVPASYCVIQNSELRDLAADLASNGPVEVESALTLFGGRRVVLLLRSASVVIGGNDEHHPYLLLANAHDGTMSLTVTPTLVRVVCQNTLTAALSESLGVAFRWRHTCGIRSECRKSEIRAALMDWHCGINRMVDIASKLNRRRMDHEAISQLWIEVYERVRGPIPSADKASTDKALRRRREAALDALEAMAEIFDWESQLLGQSAYTAANAATRWIQHGRTSRTRDARFAANIYGASAKHTRFAMRRALELSKA